MDLTLLRSFRIFDIAVFDVAVSILGAFLLSLITNRKLFLVYVLAILPVSLAVHMIFGIETAGVKKLRAFSRD